MILEQRSASFLYERPDSKYFRLRRPFSLSQLCHYNTKAGIDNTETSEHVCILIKLYLQNSRLDLAFEFMPTPGPTKTKGFWSTINNEVNYAEKLNLLMKENEKLAKV